MSNKAVGVIALIALAYLYVNRTQAPEKQIMGAKSVKIARKPDPSSTWKRNLPVPTNLTNGHPYGWRGYPANAYLVH